MVTPLLSLVQRYSYKLTWLSEQKCRCCIFAIMFWFKALQVIPTLVLVTVGSLTLPPPTGPYNVGQKPYVFEHISYNDPFWPNNISTSLLLNLYYPTETIAPPVYYI